VIKVDYFEFIIKMLAASRLFRTRPLTCLAMRNFAKANAVELPTKNQITFFNHGRMPIDVQGTVLLPAIPQREYVAEFFETKGISDD
jgi:hypothetical protein